MAESSEYNLFYFELRMQYMWPIAGGYFVNVDFVVLGHPSNKRKGDSYPFWWNKYCNKFSTSLCHLSAQTVDPICSSCKSEENHWTDMTERVFT